MASKTDLINQVLTELGQDQVDDLSPSSLDGSNAAVKVLRVYDNAYAALLESHGWLCAMSYVTLAPAADPTLANFKYTQAFVLPGDCLRVWSVRNCCFDQLIPFEFWWGANEFGLLWGQNLRWEFGTVDTDVGARKLIRSSVTSLDVAYVRQCQEEALIPTLADALVYDLAARSCKGVTGDSPDSLRKTADQKKALAMGVDGMQEAGQEPLNPAPINAVRAFARW